MQEITFKAYTFDELSDAGKSKARDWWRRGAFNDASWSEATIEEVEREGILLGIEFDAQSGKTLGGKQYTEPKIWWSGFSSQGGGACFEGSWKASNVKADKVADGWGEDPATTEIKRIAAIFAKIAKDFPRSSFKVMHTDRYYHEYSTDFSFESGADDSDPDELDRYRTTEDDPNNPDEMPRQRMADDFPEEELMEAARDFMGWIYRQLEKEYDYQNADEQVDDNIRANGYLFSESGGRTVVL